MYANDLNLLAKIICLQMDESGFSYMLVVVELANYISQNALQERHSIKGKDFYFCFFGFFFFSLFAF